MGIEVGGSLGSSATGAVAIPGFVGIKPTAYGVGKDLHRWLLPSPAPTTAVGCAAQLCEALER